MTQPPTAAFADPPVWHVLVGHQPLGPMPMQMIFSMVLAGSVTSLTPVWRAGMAAWTPAWQVPELAAAFPWRSQQKSRIAAGILGVVFGGWGVHRFYLGYVRIGILQIIVTLCTCGIGGLWGLIEGIVILAGGFNEDGHGRPLRD